MAYTDILPVRRALDFDARGKLSGITRQQYIPEENLRAMRAEREKTSWKGEETLKIASVPVALIENLQRQGIDLMQMDSKEIMAMLKNLGYERFLTYGGSL
jgi:hypothetical protein